MSHPEDLSTKKLDRIAAVQLEIFKAAFPSALILPGIGLPSQNEQKWATLTHQAALKGQSPDYPCYNGYRVRGPLDANALLSFEVATACDGGHAAFVNRYETMLPDVEDPDGGLSSTQYYVKKLQKENVVVEGNHYHWAGTKMCMGGRWLTMFAIHNTALGMHPEKFAEHQVRVLVKTLHYIEKLLAKPVPQM